MHGRPTMDAAAGLGGVQLPFGGHKGSCLALIVELLSASLIGTQLAVDGGGANEAGGMARGLFFVAFDVSAHHPDAKASAERLFAAVRDAGGRLPAEGRYAARDEAQRHGGVFVPAALLDECFGTSDLDALLTPGVSAQDLDGATASRSALRRDRRRRRSRERLS